MQRRAWARPSCSRRWRWWWARRGSGHTIRRCSSRSVGSSCSTVCCTTPGSSRVHWLRLGWSGACFRSPGSHCGPFWGIPPKYVWPCRWLRPTWLWRAGCWSGDSMNDIAPFKPKRMALEPATDPNPDIVFRFFLWLLDFEFLRVMDDNFAVVESGVKAIGPRLFFDRDVGVEMARPRSTMQVITRWNSYRLASSNLQTSSAIECPAMEGTNECHVVQRADPLFEVGDDGFTQEALLRYSRECS